MGYSAKILTVNVLITNITGIFIMPEIREL